MIGQKGSKTGNLFWDLSDYPVITSKITIILLLSFKILGNGAAIFQKWKESRLRSPKFGARSMGRMERVAIGSSKKKTNFNIVDNP